MGVALPLPVTPITPSNAGQVTALARWGWDQPEQVAWSPDSARLAVLSHTGLSILDAATLVEVVQSSVPQVLWGSRALWSPDGQWLVTTGNWGNHAVHLWSWDGTNLVRKKTFKWDTRSGKGLMELSPDGTLMAFRSAKELHLHRLADGALVQKMESPSGQIDRIAFSPDSKLLAMYGRKSGTESPPIHLWTVPEGKQVGQLSVRDFSLERLGFTPDGALLLACEKYTSAVLAWEVNSGRQLPAKEVTELRLPASRRIASSLATDKTGRLMVAVHDKERAIRRPNSTEVVGTLPDGLNYYNVDFSPDMTAVVSASCGELSVVRVADGTLLARRQGSVGKVFDLSVSPDGASLVVASTDWSGCRVRFWGLTDGTIAGVLPVDDEWARGMACTPDGSRLILGSYRNGVSIRELPSGKEIARLPEEEVVCVAVSRDGQRVAFGQVNGEVQVWDLPAASHRFTIAAHKGSVGAVSFLPDGQTILTAGTDLWGRLWRADDGAPVAKLKHNRRVLTGAVSPDGKLIATGCRDKCVYLWDASDGRPLRTLAGGRSGVARLAWSPDGDVLASASGKLVQLWNPATGALLATLSGHNLDVHALAFSPDGAILISGGQDRTLRLWGLS
jgi:WD40 repeat protein